MPKVIESVENVNDNSIERYDIKGRKFKGHILVINDPTRIKVGYSNNLGKEGQLTSEIAKDNNAIAAVNGGGFTDGASGAHWTGKGANPIGVIMSNGKIVYNNIENEDKERYKIYCMNMGHIMLLT